MHLLCAIFIVVRYLQQEYAEMYRQESQAQVSSLYDLIC